MQAVLKDTLQLTNFAPWIHPPVRGRSIGEFRRAILSTTAALDAGVNAAGLALQAALTIPGTPTLIPPLLEMGAVGEFQTLYTLQNTINIATRVTTWGITINNAIPEGVLIRVNSGSMAGGPPSAPSPFLSSADYGGHQPVFLIIQGNQTLEIEVALRDVTASPAVIDFGITGWSWPVRNREDGPEGLIPRSGYGLSCT